MPEVRYDKSHHCGATAEERIKNRLKPSGGKPGTETWPSRTHTVIHGGGQQHSEPLYDRGEIINRKGK
jgi:hypothetical protein